jgi:3-oxoacyl-[acyl-carrier protein] reductase
MVMQGAGSKLTEPLAGQVALVTGGTRGIGQHLAQAMVAAGMRVALTGRDKMVAERVARTIGGIPQVIGLPLQVTDASSVEAAFGATEAAFGPIDLVVNNAALLIPEASPWEVDAEDWWRVLEVNVRGCHLCMREAVRRMVARGSGRVINMASDTALGPWPTLSAYGTSKAALLRLTESFAVAAERHGVALFAVSPGMVKTDMTAMLPSVQDVPESAWSPPEKISALCLYLATGKADRLTGRYFHVNHDDIEACVAEAARIQSDDLNVLRLRGR